MTQKVMNKSIIVAFLKQQCIILFTLMWLKIPENGTLVELLTTSSDFNIDC